MTLSFIQFDLHIAGLACLVCLLIGMAVGAATSNGKGAAQ